MPVGRFSQQRTNSKAAARRQRLPPHVERHGPSRGGEVPAVLHLPHLCFTVPGDSRVPSFNTAGRSKRHSLTPGERHRTVKCESKTGLSRVSVDHIKGFVACRKVIRFGGQMSELDLHLTLVPCRISAIEHPGRAPPPRGSLQPSLSGAALASPCAITASSYSAAAGESASTTASEGFPTPWKNQTTRKIGSVQQACPRKTTEEVVKQPRSINPNRFAARGEAQMMKIRDVVVDVSSRRPEERLLSQRHIQPPPFTQPRPEQHTSELEIEPLVTSWSDRESHFDASALLRGVRRPRRRCCHRVSPRVVMGPGGPGDT
ncbi:hypothetical protein EYF80_002453 [Liparis tanakae]|uniref:Uncharacterized protein n=1 Tax=Liparis tanakae TaxID=230148 RepID=A0A4Z2JB90_9TELE|nr:hypothetical protein EYF80_002453 [Liparis tanakae]